MVRVGASWLRPFFNIMRLRDYFIKHGVTTGKPQRVINNSSLSVLKGWLLGERIKQGTGKEEEGFRKFGREFHKRLLEPHKRRAKMTLDEDRRINAMVKVLNNHPMFKAVVANSCRECLATGVVEGVGMQGTLDVNKGSIGADPKTTVAKTHGEFLRSAIKYGYPRQEVLYRKLAKLREFYFFGIRKEPPHLVYLVNFTTHQPQELKYYEQEANFLLYFYKTYGLPVGMKIVIKKV